MHKLYISIFFLASSIFFLQSCGTDDKIKATDVPKAPPIPAVDIFVVDTSMIVETLELPGTLVAEEETNIQSEISGRLTYLNIPEGKTVSKGTLIASIYDLDIKAQLKKLRTQLEVQQERVKRYDALLKIDGVSKQEFDLMNLETENIKADIAILETDLQRTQVRAPFTGQLGLKQVSTGAYISPQTVLTNIRDVKDLRIDFSVPERYLSKLAIGAEVNFISEGDPTIYKAKVIASESGITISDRNLKIRAKVITNSSKLLPGGFIKVQLKFDPDNNALMIPSNAIVPQARSKEVVLLKDGKANFVTVETGIRDSARIQIVSGLNKGDSIVVSGLMRLKPNDKIKAGVVTSTSTP